MIEEYRKLFPLLTTRLVGYSRCTKHSVSYFAEGEAVIELIITDYDNRPYPPRLSLTYLRYGHTRIECSLWVYSNAGDLDAFGEILDLLMEDGHPTLVRE